MTTLPDVRIRPALPADVDDIHAVLADYARSQLLLPRPSEDILERITNFRIAELNGLFAGCGALRNYGGNLYEVRSLAVTREASNAGIGSALVKDMVDFLRRSRVPVRVFALTYRSNFFCRLGFHVVDKELFPEKIWSDCANCPKRNCCDETAVLQELSHV